MNSRMELDGQQDPEVGKLNVVGRYEPYRDVPLGKPGHQTTESIDRLVTNPDYAQQRRPLSDGSELTYTDYSRVGRAY